MPAKGKCGIVVLHCCKVIMSLRVALQLSEHACVWLLGADAQHHCAISPPCLFPFLDTSLTSPRLQSPEANQMLPKMAEHPCPNIQM